MIEEVQALLDEYRSWLLPKTFLQVLHLYCFSSLFISKDFFSNLAA